MPVLCPPNGELDDLPRVRSADCGAGGQDEGYICNETRLRSGGGLVIVDNASGRVIGCTYLERALEKIGARLDREEMVPVGGVPSARMIYRVDRA